MVKRMNRRLLDLSKKAILPTPPAYDSPVSVTPLEFYKDLCRQKIKAHGLYCGDVCVIWCSPVLLQYRLVTDRRTNGYADRHKTTTCIALAARRAGKTFMTMLVTWMHSITSNVSVYLYVCLSLFNCPIAYLKNHMPKLDEILSAC